MCRLNYEKLQCKKQEVDFFSEMYTTSDCQPDKNKVTAITKMPAPTNKKQVQSFIGMINYMSKVSARLSKDWGSCQGIGKRQGTFQLGPRTPVCLYTDKKRDCKCCHIGLSTIWNKQTVLQTDASIKGLGTCLLQEEKTGYFASKALTMLCKFLLVQIQFIFENCVRH